jgi:hypothetical protein
MAKAAAANGGDTGDAPAPEDKPICGIVMPISAIDDCPATHWLDVRKIVDEAADTAGFRARLVSAAEYAGVILKGIIHNLYHDPIVVCDVSGRNPNVMFELGLRLAFDKPTILIKDDRTDYAFDTSPIEHLEYPRGLGYWTMVDFKEKLSEKIQATHKQATTNRNYTTFLKHFGEFKIAAVETKEVSGHEFVLEEMRDIKRALRQLINSTRGRDLGNERTLTSSDGDYRFLFDVGQLTDEVASELVRELGTRVGVREAVYNPGLGFCK